MSGIVPGLEYRDVLRAIEESGNSQLRPPCAVLEASAELESALCRLTLVHARSEISPLAWRLRDAVEVWHAQLKLPPSDAILTATAAMAMWATEPHPQEHASERWARGYVATRAAIAWILQQTAYRITWGQQGNSDDQVIALRSLFQRTARMRNKCIEHRAPGHWQKMVDGAYNAIARLLIQRDPVSYFNEAMQVQIQEIDSSFDLRVIPEPTTVRIIGQPKSSRQMPWEVIYDHPTGTLRAQGAHIFIPQAIKQAVEQVYRGLTVTELPASLRP